MTDMKLSDLPPEALRGGEPVGMAILRHQLMLQGARAWTMDDQIAYNDRMKSGNIAGIVSVVRMWSEAKTPCTCRRCKK